MKIAHLSDIHFYSPVYSLQQFFCKRWIGNFNALFKRRHFFITKHLLSLLDTLKKEGVTCVIISGDFTTTATKQEYLLAKGFIDKIKALGMEVFCVPGNHDLYVKEAKNKDFFSQYISQKRAFTDGLIHVEDFFDEFDLLLMDTTILNKPFMAKGEFTERMQHLVKNILERRSERKMIVVNHFPLSESSEHHRLVGDENLMKLLKNHNKDIIYLHGHTHKSEYTKDRNLHIVNSSETCVVDKFCFHTIDLCNAITVENICYE